AEDNVRLFVGPTAHGYTQENREAMYQWFNHVTHVADTAAEPKLVLEKDEALWCTPKGQVADLGSRTVFSFTRETSQALAQRRAPLSEEGLKRAVTSLLKLPERSEVPEYRILRPLSGRQYPRPHATPYAVE